MRAHVARGNKERIKGEADQRHLGNCTPGNTTLSLNIIWKMDSKTHMIVTEESVVLSQNNSCYIVIIIKNIIKENQQGLELLEKKLDVNEPMKS